MAMLPYPDPASLPADDAALLAKLPPLNIFRMLAGSGPSFQPLMALFNAYLNNGLLDHEMRELIILRVGHVCGSAYEQHQHRRVSRMIGMSDERIAAASGALPSAHLSEAENSVLVFVDSLAIHTKGDPALFERAKQHLDDAAIQEVVIVTGIYLLVCRYLETMGIEIEETDIESSGLEEIANSLSAAN
ncbi:MAG: carboxymuconolactone decarboxylase family protein [Rhizobiales bacterium]|nr:carboxymuconolactone decarboxylase family protein [Hyphomicrobiales bacterium]